MSNIWDHSRVWWRRVALSWADHPSHDCIAIHTHSINMWLRVPFYHFFHNILFSFNIIPTQLTPNAWTYIMGCSGFGRRASARPFQSIYHHMKTGNKANLQKGYYYHFSRPPRTCSNLVITPYKVHNWKESFFYVRSNWGLHRSYPHPSVTKS